MRQLRGSYWSFRDLWPWQRKLFSEVLGWDGTRRILEILKPAPTNLPIPTGNYIDTYPVTGQVFGVIAHQSDLEQILAYYHQARIPNDLATALQAALTAGLFKQPFAVAAIWVVDEKYYFIHTCQNAIQCDIYSAQGAIKFDIFAPTISDTSWGWAF